MTAVQENFNESKDKLVRQGLDAVLVITAINSPTLTSLVQPGAVRYLPLASTSGVGNKMDGCAVTDNLLTELNTVHRTQDRLDTIEQELFAMRHVAVRELVNDIL